MLFQSPILGFGTGLAAATVSNTSTGNSGSNLTAYTFSGLAIGAAITGRKVVVIASGFVSSDTINSVTVGGVSATTVLEQAVADGFLEMWQVEMPTSGGTTGDVVVTFSAGVCNCAVGVYAIFGAAFAAHDTGSDTTDTLSDTLNIPVGGVAIGGAFSANGASASFVWTNLTEDYELQHGAENTFQTGASGALEAEVARTISCAVTNESSGVAMVLASWAPY